MQTEKLRDMVLTSLKELPADEPVFIGRTRLEAREATDLLGGNPPAEAALGDYTARLFRWFEQAKQMEDEHAAAILRVAHDLICHVRRNLSNDTSSRLVLEMPDFFPSSNQAGVAFSTEDRDWIICKIRELHAAAGQRT